MGFHEEFIPEGASRSEPCVEISTSMKGDEYGFDLIVWSGGSHSSGLGLNVPIRSLVKARMIGRQLSAWLAPEKAAMLERDAIRDAEWSERRKIELEHRQAVEAAELAVRLAQITPETARVTVYVCPMCEHTDDLEEFHEATYECSTDGPVDGRGEDARRCPTCNKFTAKAGEWSCPSCEAPLDEEPEPVVGVEIDGVFMSESELPEELRAA